MPPSRRSVVVKADPETIAQVREERQPATEKLMQPPRSVRRPAPARHKPRTKGPIAPVEVRKIAYGWPDLLPKLKQDARERFGKAHARRRVKVLRPAAYREL